MIFEKTQDTFVPTDYSLYKKKVDTKNQQDSHSKLKKKRRKIFGA